jgi:hypothetical protein
MLEPEIAATAAVARQVPECLEASEVVDWQIGGRVNECLVTSGRCYKTAVPLTTNRVDRRRMIECRLSGSAL